MRLEHVCLIMFFFAVNGGWGGEYGVHSRLRRLEFTFRVSGGQRAQGKTK